MARRAVPTASTPVLFDGAASTLAMRRADSVNVNACKATCLERHRARRVCVGWCDASHAEPGRPEIGRQTAMLAEFGHQVMRVWLRKQRIGWR